MYKQTILEISFRPAGREAVCSDRSSADGRPAERTAEDVRTAQAETLYIKMYETVHELHPNTDRNMSIFKANLSPFGTYSDRLAFITVQLHLMCVFVIIPTCPSVPWLICDDYNKGGRGASSIAAAGSVAFRQTRAPCVGFCSLFPRCRVSKMSVLIFVNELLSWLFEWRHWPANRCHANWHHILVPARVPWNLGRAGTIAVCGANPENRRTVARRSE